MLPTHQCWHKNLDWQLWGISCSAFRRWVSEF